MLRVYVSIPLARDVLSWCLISFSGMKSLVTVSMNQWPNDLFESKRESFLLNRNDIHTSSLTRLVTNRSAEAWKKAGKFYNLYNGMLWSTICCILMSWCWIIALTTYLLDWKLLTIWPFHRYFRINLNKSWLLLSQMFRCPCDEAKEETLETGRVWVGWMSGLPLNFSSLFWNAENARRKTDMVIQWCVATFLRFWKEGR